MDIADINLGDFLKARITDKNIGIEQGNKYKVLVKLGWGTNRHIWIEVEKYIHRENCYPANQTKIMAGELNKYFECA